MKWKQNDENGMKKGNENMRWNEHVLNLFFITFHEAMMEKEMKRRRNLQLEEYEHTPKNWKYSAVVIVFKEYKIPAGCIETVLF